MDKNIWLLLLACVAYLAGHALFGEWIAGLIGAGGIYLMVRPPAAWRREHRSLLNHKRF